MRVEKIKIFGETERPVNRRHDPDVNWIGTGVFYGLWNLAGGLWDYGSVGE
jgi:hypothetical protein